MSTRTLKRRIQAGRIHVVRDERLLKVPVEEIDAYIERLKASAA